MEARLNQVLVGCTSITVHRVKEEVEIAGVESKGART